MQTCKGRRTNREHAGASGAEASEEAREGFVEKIAGEIRQETPMSRIAFASFIGTMIGFYDFYIYGLAAALVFPALFFPELSPASGLLASFATYGVAFLA